MNTQQIIQRVLGRYLEPSKSYPTPLPDALRQWYCYTRDGGHSILVAVESLYSSGSDPSTFLVPAPVKTVLRGYEQRDGYIVADLPYNARIGLVVPPEDEEF